MDCPPVAVATHDAMLNTSMQGVPQSYRWVARAASLPLSSGSPQQYLSPRSARCAALRPQKCRLTQCPLYAGRLAGAALAPVWAIQEVSKKVLSRSALFFSNERTSSEVDMRSLVSANRCSTWTCLAFLIFLAARPLGLAAFGLACFAANESASPGSWRAASRSRFLAIRSSRSRS